VKSTARMLLLFLLQQYVLLHLSYGVMSCSCRLILFLLNLTLAQAGVILFGLMLK